jgi:hypothetical protein
MSVCLLIRPSFTQDPRDRGHRIPVSRGNWYPKEPVEGAEIADDFHVAPVHADDEPVVFHEDFQQPCSAGRKAHGQRRRPAGASGHNAYEADDVRSHGLVGEMILRQQPDNLATLTDHDLRIKRKPGYELGAELRRGDRLSDHEGARCANVDRVQMLQLFGERCRSEGPVTTHVDASQKNYEGQEFLLLGRSIIVHVVARLDEVLVHESFGYRKRALFTP